MLLAAAAAEEYFVKSWDKPGAYINEPNDPRFRFTMKQLSMGDGSYRAKGSVCVLRRAMPGDPAANAQ